MILEGLQILLMNTSDEHFFACLSLCVIIGKHSMHEGREVDFSLTNHACPTNYPSPKKRWCRSISSVESTGHRVSHALSVGLPILAIRMPAEHLE